MSHPLWYTIRMNKMKNDKPNKTYELWFSGDIVGEPLPKNRHSLNTLLKEAHQILTDAATVSGGVGVGSAEIFCRQGDDNETVWSMSIDEFTKGHRLPIKAL